jgi:hypothetical protein
MLRTRAVSLLVALVGASSGNIGAQDPAVSQASTDMLAAADPGEVEPELLPGNAAPLPPESFIPPAEPPLPVAEDAEAADVVEFETTEVAAVPRRFRYAITVEARGVYDDNITLSRGSSRRSDYSAQLTAGAVLGFGDVIAKQGNYISATYSPTGYLYVENSEFDTIEHIFHLDARWRPGRFAFNLTQDFQSVQSTNLGVLNTSGGFNNQTNLDVGGRRRVTTYATRIETAVDLTGKTALRLGALYSLSEPEGFLGSTAISGYAGADYQFGAKLRLGADLTFGDNSIEGPTPDQTFQQLNLRGSYEISGKVNATGSAGVELRQSDDSDEGQFSPIFQLGLTYQPFDGSTISMSAIRRTQNSAVNAGQDFTSTQFTTTAQQRFFQRVFASLAAGYQTQSYFSSLSGLSFGRDDNYYFVTVGVDVRVTAFWFAGIYYVHRQNDSSLDLYTFDDNQIGVRSNVQF